MKLYKVVLVAFLISSLLFGDKLHLWNGEVYEGEYEGIVDGTPIFLVADNGNSITLIPENVKKITDDNGNLIVTGDDLFYQKRKRTERTLGWVIISAVVIVMVGLILVASSKEGGTKWDVWSPG